MTNLHKAVVVILLVLLGVSGYLYLNPKEADSQASEGESYVYETEVDSADQCSSYEKFDAERNICYFECTDEVQCKQIEKSIDDEFASWTEELKNDPSPVKEKVISENDPSSEAQYSVSSGEQIALVEGEDNELYRQIWDEIAALSPDTLSDTYIDEYQIFNNPEDDTLAFVVDEDGNGKWKVAVNLAGYKSSTARENKATFVHELFHIASLNSSQVNPNISDCSNFKLDEGCANGNAYINQFKNTFWNGVDKQEYEEGKFITEYAATNEVEDLAESFSFFVLGKDQNELGDTLADQKLKFFYQYPELTSLRTGMRNAISRDIIRARQAN